MHGESNRETCITICKIDSQREFAIWLRKLKQGLCINPAGWDGKGDGREVQKGGDICISQFSSVAQACPTLCDPMNLSTPGLPVHHQLPEYTKLMSIELVMPSNHLILCRPLLLLPSIFPSIRVFSNESTLHMRWPKYWSFSFTNNPSNEHPGMISFTMDWLDLLAVQGTLKSLL